MAILSSSEILEATVKMGVSKAAQNSVSRFANTFLAGAYIAIGGFLAVRVGLPMSWEMYGPLGKFMFGAVFPIGLMLVLICGADLFTGNCMTLTTAMYRSKVSAWESFYTGVTSWLGNFLGALFVAYVLAFSTGVIFETVNGTMPWAEAVVKLANGKTSLDFDAALFRGIGCNWLVCLAVYAAASSQETIGKIFALWLPTMTFVSLGFEHCIANMFFIPLGILVGSSDSYLSLVQAGKAVSLTADWSSFFIDNLIPVTIGNILGGSVLVGMLYLMANNKLSR